MARDLKRLRREAVELLQEFTAIVLLTNSIEGRALAMLADDEAKLMIATSRKELRASITKLRVDVASWRDDKEVHASRQELIDLLQGIRATPEGQAAFIRKAHLSRLIGWYNHYPVPAHCQMGFRKEGIDSKHWLIHSRLLEALLYEDMCALYNLSQELSREPEIPARSKVRFKQVAALRRAVVTTAFYFLESYLNGLAYDFLATTKRSLTEKDRGLLTESDRYTSFPKKLLNYPRIILGLEDPPLQASNCEPLAFMLEHIKTLRDAIVHASPTTLDPAEAMSAKELALFNMEPGLIDRIVDETIALVRTIDRTIGRDDIFLDWLKDREHGRFPEAAFA